MIFFSAKRPLRRLMYFERQNLFNKKYTFGIMQSKKILEVCCGNQQSVVAAAAAGAHRIELCGALELGGITPSAGAMKLARKTFKGPIQVLIRPREGNFYYSDDEIKIIRNDIKILKKLGADGIVFGALTKEKQIDFELLECVIEVSYPTKVTFHRAFDESVDDITCVEKLAQFGCERLLTSGRKNTAIEGIETIKTISAKYHKRIKIMPGSEITPENVNLFVEMYGILEVHSSCSEMMHSTNGHSIFEKNKIRISSEIIIKQMLNSLK